MAHKNLLVKSIQRTISGGNTDFENEVFFLYEKCSITGLGRILCRHDLFFNPQKIPDCVVH